MLYEVITAGWVVYAASKQSYRGRQIEKEIEDLRAQADKIRMENTTLQEKIAYFDSRITSYNVCYTKLLRWLQAL